MPLVLEVGDRVCNAQIVAKKFPMTPRYAVIAAIA